MRTTFSSQDIIAQAFITSTGKKILLINPRKKELKIKLPPGVKDGTAIVVDVSAADDHKEQVQLADSTITLKPFAVEVITLKY